MGDVAAPASGNADFRQKARAFLDQCDLGVWRGGGASDRREKSGCAPARHHDTSWTHQREVTLVYGGRSLTVGRSMVAWDLQTRKGAEPELLIHVGKPRFGIDRKSVV